MDIQQIDQQIAELQAQKQRIKQEQRERERQEREAASEEAMREIREVCEAYNAAEQDQHARLERLFELVSRSGQGYRAVRFGGSESWDNCWPTGDGDRFDNELRLTRASQVPRMVRRIVRVECPMGMVAL